MGTQATGERFLQISQSGPNAYASVDIANLNASAATAECAVEMAAYKFSLNLEREVGGNTAVDSRCADFGVWRGR